MATLLDRSSKMARSHRPLSSCCLASFVLSSGLFAALATAQSEFRLTAANEAAYPLSLIRVPVEMGDAAGNDHETHTFILDTGAAISVVDPSLEKYCTGEPEERIMNAGSGSLTVKKFPWLRARLGSGEAIGECGLLEMNPFAESCGYRLSGFLGTPVVQKSGFGYIAAGGYFYLGISHVRMFQRRYDLQIRDGLYYTSDIQLGESTSTFLIDTGLNAPLCVRRELFDQLIDRGLISEVALGQVLTLTGDKVYRVGMLASINAWGTQFSDVMIMEGAHDVVGLEMLMKFDFRMNCRARKIEVSENSETKLPFLNGVRYLVLIRRNGVVQVGEVLEDTDIDLKADDIVISVNSKKVTDAWDEVVKIHRLLSDPATKSVEFEVERDGKLLQRTLMK